FYHNATAPEIDTLSLHDALPISRRENVRTSVVAACFDGLPGSRERLRDARRPVSESTAKERSCHFSPAISIRNAACATASSFVRSEEHTSELQSRSDLVCRLLLE